MERAQWTDEALDQRMSAIDATFERVFEELRVERAEMRAEMRVERAEMRAEMRAERADMRADMQAGIADVRAEMRAGFDRISRELAQIRLVLYGLLSTVAAVSLAAFLANA
jgi:hypothetical protein